MEVHKDRWVTTASTWKLHRAVMWHALSPPSQYLEETSCLPPPCLSLQWFTLERNSFPSFLAIYKLSSINYFASLTVRSFLVFSPLSTFASRNRFVFHTLSHIYICRHVSTILHSNHAKRAQRVKRRVSWQERRAGGTRRYLPHCRGRQLLSCGIYWRIHWSG